MKISEDSQRLLDQVVNLEGWPEKVKVMQENWIGKSTGVSFEFECIDIDGEDCTPIRVFTTRPDTLFGMSFLALSIDHPLAKLYEKDKHRNEA